MFSRRPLSTLGDVLILFTNGLMLICLVALSIVALLIVKACSMALAPVPGKPVPGQPWGRRKEDRL
jgi:hypothetical protein